MYVFMMLYQSFKLDKTLIYINTKEENNESKLFLFIGTIQRPGSNT
jgi:hypothetical protein